MSRRHRGAAVAAVIGALAIGAPIASAGAQVPTTTGPIGLGPISTFPGGAGWPIGIGDDGNGHWPGGGEGHFPGHGNDHFPEHGKRHFPEFPEHGKRHFPEHGKRHFPEHGKDHFPGKGKDLWPGDDD